MRLWTPGRNPVGEALPKHTDLVVGLAFSPNSKLLASVTNTPVRGVQIWDVATRRVMHKFDFPAAPNNVMFAADGKHLVVAMSSGVAYVLKLPE